ncbi:Esterase/lipase [Anaerohalosphaera lusitana]|uniref:Esterase/lipase n=1 Tax=Anaerohalosphaera lusitana TaxID=1936003 RepID=A0A1U9NQW7_9BACT|nr:alpha/beta hydrolase [Anaerohalosphaera lusitana]AQT70010.1 Esterase/lipase [Anaerohalosphaera lusitana]
MIWLLPLIILLAYSIIGWTIYFIQPSLLYQPKRTVLYDPSDIGLAFENVTLNSTAGCKLSAWFVPAVNARLTVLLCHANAGNISHRLDTVKIFHDLGINCMLFDYQGYGLSQGSPTEQGTYDDARSAWNWLTRIKGIPENSIILFGRSLGGCIAAQLASSVHPAGLVVESAFTSYIEIGKHYYPFMPVKLFAEYRYPTADYIRRIDCPLLIMHSKADKVVPYEMGLKLHDIAHEPKEFARIYGSHNEGFLHSGSRYIDIWDNWIRRIATSTPDVRPEQLRFIS